MLYRNLLALETEELLRSYPIDGAVLMGGCDKTTPGLLMGAITADLPAIFMPAGPMLRGRWRGRPVGSGTEVWRAWADRQAGALSAAVWNELEDGIARSPGHCMTMGTASTMTAATEALGLTLPGASSIPAVDADHARMAMACGRRVVELVSENLRPSAILQEASFRNATRVVLALGGSTNAVIHLVALARRAGIELGLVQFDALSRETPVLANVQPSGEFLMEDFFMAGGLRAMLVSLAPLLELEAATVNGTPLSANIAGAETYDVDVIRPFQDPLFANGGITVLQGTLAPDGAVVKTSAAEKRLLQHVGAAIVFDDYEDLEARLDHRIFLSLRIPSSS